MLVPRSQPRISLLPAVSRRIPFPPLAGNAVRNRLITRPVTRLPPPEIRSPFEPAPARDPSISMIGVPAKPGCVVPSIVTGSRIVGSADVGWIVLAPDPIEKRIVSVPGVALAALIASRSVQVAALQTPSSVSALELTVKVAAGDAAVTARHRSPASTRAGCTGRSLAQPRRQGAAFASAAEDER